MGAFVDFVMSSDRRGALQTFRRVWNEFGSGPRTHSIAAYGAPVEVRMCLQLGETSWGREACDRVQRLLPGSAEASVATAMLAAAAGRVDQARALVGPVVDGQTPAVVRTTIVDAALLQATIEDRSARDAHAFEALATAVEHAAELGTMLAMFSEGAAIRELLVRNSGRFGRHNGFVDSVLRRIEGGRETASLLAAPLTPAELATLDELPSHLTFAEIAHARGVSVNT